MTFLLGLVIGIWVVVTGGVFIPALFASASRREAAEIYQLRPKQGRDRDGKPAV